MQIVIITPVEVEYQKLRFLLRDRQAFRGQDGLRYETGLIDGKTGPLPAAIHLSGSKTVDVALATEKAIRQFQPGLILLAGIAGGVKDAAIGDIVVGTKAYGYESGKEGEKSFSARPDVYLFDREFIDFTREFARRDNWQRTLPGQTRPQVHFGPIASGEKLVASAKGEVSRLLAIHYNDTVALEMEAIGFAKAVSRHRDVRGMNIRGVSDLLGHKKLTDQQGGQHQAVEHLFLFLQELFRQLDPAEFQTANHHSGSSREVHPPGQRQIPPGAKNVISGSTINVGGNFQLGDVNSSQGKKATPAPPPPGKDVIQALRTKVGKNRLDEVISELLAICATRPAYTIFNDDILQIQRRLSELKRQERMGLIRYDEAGRGHSQIAYALLKTISELD